MKFITIFLTIIIVMSLLLTGCGEVTDNTEDETTVEDITSETTEAETTSDIELSFELVAGVQGEYGQPIIYNANTEFEEKIYGYYVPSGEYRVTNIGSYPTQINVLDEGKNIVDGWEEGILVEVFLIGINEVKTFNVLEGCHIEIAEPTHLLMEKLK